MTGKIDCHGRTDVGRQRDVNQDNFLIAQLEKALDIQESSLSFGERDEMASVQRGHVLAVADGMGGHAGGEHASRLALEAASEFVVNTIPWFQEADEQSDDELNSKLEQAIALCQKRLLADEAEHPERHGMGTTLTLAYIVWPTMHLLHVGDSRCYLLRDGAMTRLTVDQTVAQQMIDRNVPPERIAERWYHTLWNVIGGSERSVETSVQDVDLQLGDTVLLCSDGLTGHVEDDEILQMLKTGTSAAEQCQQFVDLANDRGGSDNITVVVARFLSADQAADIAESISLGDDEPDPTADTIVFEQPFAT